MRVESVGVAIISVSRKYMVERASHPGCKWFEGVKRI
jgi:hypothetical protein